MCAYLKFKHVGEVYCIFMSTLDRRFHLMVVISHCAKYMCTGMRRIMTFRSMTDRIYDGGSVRL